jgi:hypothetical protein
MMSNKEKIEVGDLVEITFLIGKQSQSAIGEVVGMPNDTGDMWKIKHIDNEIVYYNPNCSALVMIKLLEPEVTDDPNP